MFDSLLHLDWQLKLVISQKQVTNVCLDWIWRERTASRDHLRY